MTQRNPLLTNEIWGLPLLEYPSLHLSIYSIKDNLSWPLESGFLMRKSEKKGDYFLGSKCLIFKFTLSVSSHQIQQLGYNKIFVFLFLEKTLVSSPMCDVIDNSQGPQPTCSSEAGNRSRWASTQGGIFTQLEPRRHWRGDQEWPPHQVMSGTRSSQK